MQTSPASTNTSLPQPPAPPTPPQPTGIILGGQTVPISLSALKAKGSELSDQLRSVKNRRDGLLRDLRRASPDARPGLQSNIAVLDQRVISLENEITANGIARADAAITQTGKDNDDGADKPPTGASDVSITAISIVFTIFVLCPVAVSFARLMWKRASRPAASPASRESELRLERVEQAVDAIAVEVERISEGQRFVTQLLSKSSQIPALGVGQAEPIKVPINETVMAAKSFKAS